MIVTIDVNGDDIKIFHYVERGSGVLEQMGLVEGFVSGDVLKHLDGLIDEVKLQDGE